LDLKHNLNDMKKRLEKAMAQHLADKRQQLKLLAANPVFSNPFARFEQRRQELDHLAMRMETALSRFLEEKNGILKLLATKLELLSPLAILARGYSLTYNKDHVLIKSINQVAIDEQVLVRLAKGKLRCRVLEKEN